MLALWRVCKFVVHSFMMYLIGASWLQIYSLPCMNHQPNGRVMVFSSGRNGRVMVFSSGRNGRVMVFSSGLNGLGVLKPSTECSSYGFFVWAQWAF